MIRSTRMAVMAVLVLAPAMAMAQGERGKSAQQQAEKKFGVMLPQEEKGFLERVHQSNGVEIELSKMAVEKAQTPEVRQFAQMLVDDHTKADAELMQMAKQNNMKLGKPSKLQGAEKQMQEETRTRTALLRALDGLVFEQSYLATMVERHDHNILKFAEARQKYQGSKFSPMYEAMLPTLTQHRQQAYQLLGTVASPTKVQGVGGSGQQGSMPMPMDSHHGRMNKPAMPASPPAPGTRKE